VPGNVSYPSFQGTCDAAIRTRTAGHMPTYERIRFTDVYDGEVVELDAIHLPTSDWDDLVAGEPSFLGWRFAHLPSGFTMAIEPIGVVVTRLLDSVRPDLGGSGSGGA
jgi:hypothetical protein